MGRLQEVRGGKAANSEPTARQRGAGRAGLCERDLIFAEPNRIDEPEAGQGTERGRLTDSSGDLGQMKTCNSSNEKP